MKPLGFSNAVSLDVEDVAGAARRRSDGPHGSDGARERVAIAMAIAAMHMQVCETQTMVASKAEHRCVMKWFCAKWMASHLHLHTHTRVISLIRDSD